VLLEITTTGKTVLLIIAALFIAWALVTAVIVPRRNPDFPLSVGAFIAISAVFFIAQMGAVYWVTSYQEVEHETAGEVAGGGETTPAETTPAETTPAETTSAETTTTETAPTETSPAGGAGVDAAAGKEVFASAGCGSCHTLADAGAKGSVGPNLDEVKPSADRVVDRVTNGQGVMPPFKDQLDEQQIQDVAAYVSSVAGSSS
jgi:mono/diheme cytochrome c family protein